MEDAHTVDVDLDHGKAMFAVFDGHGGHEVGNECLMHLYWYNNDQRH